MESRSAKLAALVAAASFLLGIAAFAQSENQPGQGQAVVTVLPGKNAPAPAIAQQQLSVKVNGKESTVTRWKQFGPNAPVEMVLLIDGAARTSLGTQMQEIEKFVQSLPANTSATIAYMQNGEAVLSGPLTTDRAETLRGLHLTGGISGISASPYFCLSSLAKQWPSNNGQARREVVMVTDGVDYYNGALRFDPEDPYVQTAIEDSARAQLVVYSIYWRNTGRLDRTMAATNAGQNLLGEVTEATGGNSYWEGFGDPVSFQPYFEDIERRLNNQYELGFMAPSHGKTEVDSFKLKVSDAGAKIDAPEQVLVLGSEMVGAAQ
jgi:hypothetical protein